MTTQSELDEFNEALEQVYVACRFFTETMDDEEASDAALASSLVNLKEEVDVIDALLQGVHA